MDHLAELRSSKMKNAHATEGVDLDFGMGMYEVGLMKEVG